MARKKPVTDVAFVQFNVLYQDGSQTSNRKVPTASVDVSDEDEVQAFIEADDRRIAALSGNPRGPVKSITRVNGR